MKHKTLHILTLICATLSNTISASTLTSKTYFKNEVTTDLLTVTILSSVAIKLIYAYYGTYGNSIFVLHRSPPDTQVITEVIVPEAHWVPRTLSFSRATEYSLFASWSSIQRAMNRHGIRAYHYWELQLDYYREPGSDDSKVTFTVPPLGSRLYRPCVSQEDPEIMRELARQENPSQALQKSIILSSKRVPVSIGGCPPSYWFQTAICAETIRTLITKKLMEDNS